MYSKQNHSLVDRVLAPSTRLMARFRFGQKAMLIGASFLVTCAVLAGLLFFKIRADLHQTQQAMSAIAPADALYDGMFGMQHHRELVVRQSYKEALKPGAMESAQAAADAGFTRVAAWETATLGKTSPALAEARAAWTKALGAHADANAATADHDAAIGKARLLMQALDEESGLALVNDPVMHYLSRAVVEQMPMLTEYASQQAVVATRVAGEGSIWADDRAHLAVANAMSAYLLNNIKAIDQQVRDSDPALAAKVSGPIEASRQALATQDAVIQKHVLDAETPDIPLAAMGARAEATRAALQHSYDQLNAALKQSAGTFLASHKRQASLVAGIIAFALLLSGYLFLGFSRSTRASLQKIEEAAQMLARGQFPDQVRVDSQDELRGIGNSLERAVKTLRGFEQAQRALFEAHQAGQISERLDSEAFDGAFGVMANEINTLVASHIAVKMRVIEVVSAYARGDLSQDIERMPGEKARVTEGVDAVKAGMLAVNAEIKALVDAAVAGDFSRRGDAQRFQFVYRDLVESLNTLMATADGGLNEVGALLSAVADGDLNRRVEGDLPGQFGSLAEDANRTVDQLTQIVAQIRVGSDAINAAAGEIAAGNNDLSQRTEQQAASLEETASSMEELTSTVKQNADNARQANQLAQGAADVAEQGGAVVGQVVHTMSAISDSSKKIADIIGVIDGIAFQTNILALNAAVEAARAGEQGRGFAVVASEVRSLAQRSANAAKEIKQLITDSVGKVEEGSQLVDRAGRTMGEIVTSVKRVTDIIADIAAASAEQSAGIEQVNVAITSMDEGTQQNAALVEEASASARSLEQQAEQLVTTVAVFRVDPARMAQVERPQAAVVQLAAPRARKPAAAVAAKPVARRPRAQAAVAGNEVSNWQEF
ncbi:MAG TPA: methyl-accepting chemotaxis protein [Xanthomonadaceae bacterium]|nr:methyl-accepting chemotaxis protein [Xanthomonadaceae bacterium]